MLNRYKPGKVRTSYENLGSELKIAPEMAFSSLRQLANKGVINLIQLPVPKSTMRQLLVRILEYDAANLFSKSPSDEYRNKRQHILQELDDLVALDKNLSNLKDKYTPLDALEACARVLDTLSFLERFAEEAKESRKDDVAEQNRCLRTEAAVLLNYSASLGAKIRYMSQFAPSGSIEQDMESKMEVLSVPNLLEHVASLGEDLDTLIARYLVRELSEEQYRSSLQPLLRRFSGKKTDMKIHEKLSGRLDRLKERNLLDENNYAQLKNLLSWDISSLKIAEQEKTVQDIFVELTKSADQYVPRCGIDERIIDGSFQTIKCMSCGSEFCLLPCGGIIVEKNRICPRCGREGFPRLQYQVYLARLDQLRSSGKISNEAYEKLKDEYKVKMR